MEELVELQQEEHTVIHMTQIFNDIGVLTQEEQQMLLLDIHIPMMEDLTAILFQIEHKNIGVGIQVDGDKVLRDTHIHMHKVVDNLHQEVELVEDK